MDCISEIASWITCISEITSWIEIAKFDEIAKCCITHIIDRVTRPLLLWLYVMVTAITKVTSHGRIFSRGGVGAVKISEFKFDDVIYFTD